MSPLSLSPPPTPPCLLASHSRTRLGVDDDLWYFGSCVATVTGSLSGPRKLFKGVIPAMSGVLARFPLLLPVRNSFASYGVSAVARTSDRGHVTEAINHFIEVVMSTCAVSSKHKDAEHRPLVVGMIFWDLREV